MTQFLVVQRILKFYGRVHIIRRFIANEVFNPLKNKTVRNNLNVSPSSTAEKAFILREKNTYFFQHNLCQCT